MPVALAVTVGLEVRDWLRVPDGLAVPVALEEVVRLALCVTVLERVCDDDVRCETDIVIDGVRDIVPEREVVALGVRVRLGVADVLRVTVPVRDDV